MAIRILIADDHDVVRQGLCTYLEVDDELEVIGDVSSILGKLGVQSRTQAALCAGRIGLVPVSQLGATEATC